MASTDTQPRIGFLEEPMRLYIDGAFVETDEGLPSLNPATGEQLAEAPLASTREVDAAVAAAGRAFDEWRVPPPPPPPRGILGVGRPPPGGQEGGAPPRGARPRTTQGGGGA